MLEIILLFAKKILTLCYSAFLMVKNFIVSFYKLICEFKEIIEVSDIVKKVNVKQLKQETQLLKTLNHYLEMEIPENIY